MFVSKYIQYFWPAVQKIHVNGLKLCSSVPEKNVNSVKGVLGAVHNGPLYVLHCRWVFWAVPQCSALHSHRRVTVTLSMHYLMDYGLTISCYFVCLVWYTGQCSKPNNFKKY